MSGYADYFTLSKRGSSARYAVYFTAYLESPHSRRQAIPTDLAAIQVVTVHRSGTLRNFTMARLHGVRGYNPSKVPSNEMRASLWYRVPYILYEWLRGVFTTRRYTNPRLPYLTDRRSCR